MPIPVTCPQCGTVLSAPDGAAGKRAKCRTCQAVLTIPTPNPSGLDLIEEATTADRPMPAAVRAAVAKPAAARPPMAMPAMASPAIPESFVPSEPVPAGPRYGELPPADDFSFDDAPASASKVKKRAIQEDDEDEDDRPRKKRRRDEDDDEDDRPRGRAAKAEKKSGAMPYILMAMVAVFLLALTSFAGYYFLVREKTVPTEPPPPPKPKGPTAPVTKPTAKEPPKEWEREVDVDFVAFLPKEGHKLKKQDGAFPNIKDFPELGEVRAVTKDISDTVDIYAFIFTIKPGSLGEVNKDPKRSIAGWSDLFLIKVPADDVTITDFSNAEFGYKGKQYVYQQQMGGPKNFLRMFVAQDKFYVIVVKGFELTDRNEYVKNYFDSFQPTK